MLLNIFKTFFIFIACIFTTLKLQNTYTTKHLSKELVLFINILTIFISQLINLTVLNELRYIIPLLFLWLFASIFTNRPQISFVIVITSFYLSYGFFVLTGFLISLAISIFYYNKTTPPYYLFSIFAGLITILLISFLFHSKRFSNGIYKILLKKHLNIITYLYCASIIFIVPIPSTTNTKNKFYILILFIIALILIIYTWQSAITKSYLQASQQREIDSLNNELNEKNKLIEKLSQQNENMGTLIHRDNKLIPTMEYAVSQYLLSDLSDPISAKEKGDTLLQEIKELSSFRQNILDEISYNIAENYDTGLPLVDELLCYMKQKARMNKIIFNIFIPQKLGVYVPSVLENKHCLQLLSDLLENAFIAVKSCKTPIIQLQIYLTNNHLVIEVSDNGIPFEIDTLLALGLTHATTHGDEGGSGIGYMDIWKTKRLYKATLQIIEYEPATPFSKKIQLVFDKKNNYLISSPRKAEIEAQSNRIDLQLL